MVGSTYAGHRRNFEDCSEEALSIFFPDTRTSCFLELFGFAECCVRKHKHLALKKTVDKKVVSYLLNCIRKTSDVYLMGNLMEAIGTR